MALNQKAIKVLGKVFEAGFTDEKSIAAMTMDDILAIQGITIADIGLSMSCKRVSRQTRSFPFSGVMLNEYRAYQPYYSQKRRCISVLTQLQ